ncbi:MAG: nucleoside-diphosphate kinase [Chitinispirillaceae bacterium]|nr:nucleoside-diphosphate kinase [Chitinispirillaceae bacterium]
MENAPKTQTLVLFKPDSLKNSLAGFLMSSLSEINTGLLLAGIKSIQVSRLMAEEHYSEHKGKGFFPSVVEYLMGLSHFADEPKKQWVIALVYEGVDAIKKVRDVAGPTNPINARIQKPGCIRSLGALIPVTDSTGKTIDNRIDNLIHASSSESDAEKEIKLWFKPNEIPTALRGYPTVTSLSSFYYSNGNLLTSYTDGAVCLLAAGDLAWKSDLDALTAIASGKPSPVSLDAIAAKYIANL